MQYPIIERLVLLHAAQYASYKAFKTRGTDAEKNNHMSYVDFKYLTTCRAANQCGFRGLCTNWLKWWTTNITSDRVKFIYKRRPINLQNRERSSNNSPFSSWSCKPYGKGVGASFARSIPVFEIMLVMYFRWFTHMPAGDLAISRPKKYLACPRSFIVKAVCKDCLSCYIKASE